MLCRTWLLCLGVYPSTIYHPYGSSENVCKGSADRPRTNFPSKAQRKLLLAKAQTIHSILKQLSRTHTHMHTFTVNHLLDMIGTLILLLFLQTWLRHKIYLLLLLTTSALDRRLILFRMPRSKYHATTEKENHKRHTRANGENQNDPNASSQPQQQLRKQQQQRQRQHRDVSCDVGVTVVFGK